MLAASPALPGSAEATCSEATRIPDTGGDVVEIEVARAARAAPSRARQAAGWAAVAALLVVSLILARDTVRRGTVPEPVGPGPVYEKFNTAFVFDDSDLTPVILTEESILLGYLEERARQREGPDAVQPPAARADLERRLLAEARASPGEHPLHYVSLGSDIARAERDAGDDDYGECGRLEECLAEDLRRWDIAAGVSGE